MALSKRLKPTISTSSTTNEKSVNKSALPNNPGTDLITETTTKQAQNIVQKNNH